MSLSNHCRSGERWRARWCGVLALLFAWLALPARLRAEEGPIVAWARWVTAQGRWAGPTVPFPDALPRPALGGYTLDSEWLPLRLHAPASARVEHAEAALAAFESAWERLAETGWPLPFADGGRGGSSSFDLYLVEHMAASAGAEVDAPIAWTPYDAATSWALVDAAQRGEALEASIVSALVQAALLGQDPAESALWRRATGAFAAYLATGRFGCGEEVVDRQRAPSAGWTGPLEDVAGRAGASKGAAGRPGGLEDAAGVAVPPEDAAGAAALFLALVSEREDGGSGAFVREAWQLARQHSEEPRLRGSPNVVEALARALANAGESFEAVAIDAAVARYFAGPSDRRVAATRAVLRALPSDAEIPLVRDLAPAELPEHVPLHPPLAELGSAFVRVDVSSVPAGQSLPVWLRGDPAARWSLALVRLGSDGRELGRVVAPPRPVPSGYVPLLLEPGTDSVLVVVTALPREPDRFTPDPDAERHAKLILGDPQSTPR